MLDESGPLECGFGSVEVMGRDISVVSENPNAVKPTVRSIISSENRVDRSQKTVRFSLKPKKVFIFDKNTEERLRFETE